MPSLTYSTPGIYPFTWAGGVVSITLDAGGGGGAQGNRNAVIGGAGGGGGGRATWTGNLTAGTYTVYVGMGGNGWPFDGGFDPGNGGAGTYSLLFVSVGNYLQALPGSGGDFAEGTGGAGGSYAFTGVFAGATGMAGSDGFNGANGIPADGGTGGDAGSGASGGIGGSALAPGSEYDGGLGSAPGAGGGGGAWNDDTATGTGGGGGADGRFYAAWTVATTPDGPIVGVQAVSPGVGLSHPDWGRGIWAGDGGCGVTAKSG